MANQVSSSDKTLNKSEAKAVTSIDRALDIASRSWPYLLLIAVLWIVRFWHSAEFGLYEDDLTYLPEAASMSLGELAEFVLDSEHYLQLHGNGRPFHLTFIMVLMNLSWRVGDLQALYLLGFAIEAINVALVYALLRRIHSKPLGVLGGIAYVLYAADTTQAYLTLAFGMQTAFTLFLLATHAYLSRRHWLTYILAIATILTYEAAFTVLFAIPILAYRPGRQWRREALQHIVVIGMLLATIVLLRYFVADDRLGNLSLAEAISIPISHMIVGPVVSIGTYIYRPLQSLQSISREVLLASLAFFVAAVALLSRLELNTPVDLARRIRDAFNRARSVKLGLGTLRTGWKDLPDELTVLIRLAGTGLLMLILAYPLTFTVRAYAIGGRDTRVHSAGVFGAAVLVGSILLIILWIAEAHSRKRVVGFVIALWLGLMAGYGFVIQNDYRLAWEYQKSFWSDLVTLLPDAADGTVILIDPVGLNDPVQIGANYWNLPRVLNSVYQFPVEWERPPMVYRLSDNWLENIISRDEMLTLNGVTTFAPAQTHGEFSPQSAILIRTAAGELERASEPLRFGGITVRLKTSLDEGEPPYAQGFLYGYLIDSAEQSGSAPAE